jgi:hypothetical protein
LASRTSVELRECFQLLNALRDKPMSRPRQCSENCAERRIPPGRRRGPGLLARGASHPEDHRGCHPWPLHQTHQGARQRGTQLRENVGRTCSPIRPTPLVRRPPRTSSRTECRLALLRKASVMGSTLHCIAELAPCATSSAAVPKGTRAPSCPSNLGCRPRFQRWSVVTTVLFNLNPH